MAHPQPGADGTHIRKCPLCEASCGIELDVSAGKVTAVRGDAADPLSRGHICPKATALPDVHFDPDRLTRPMKRSGNSWTEIDWDQALDEVTARLVALRETHGADAIATYLGNPNAHNYGATLHLPGLLRHFGKRARFSASTVDQMPHHMTSFWMYGHKDLFTIPDIDRTDFMLMIGANPLASNGSIWTVPDVRKRIKALQARGGQLVVLDPRRTETADVASAHHFIRPGQDAAFLIALLRSLNAQGLVDPGRLSPMIATDDGGWSSIWAALDRFDGASLTAACGIPRDAIDAIAQAFGTAQSAICYGRIGVSTQPFGTLCQWLIQLVNIATGNLDRAGGMMFSTPAADLLAVAGPGGYDRWQSRVSGYPEACGELPAASMAEEMLTPGDGQVQALITCAGNPVLSTPNGRQLDKALAQLDFMVCIDSNLNETTRHAHYILPPSGPLARSHYDHAFLSLAVRNTAHFSPPTFAPGPDDRQDWEIISALGTRIAEALGKPQNPVVPPEVMLDGLLAAGPTGLTVAKLLDTPHGVDLGPLEPRLPDRLFTPDRKIHLAPALLVADLQRFAAQMANTPTNTLALIGRRHVRSNNSWMHNSQRLVKGPDRCRLMVNPDDARSRNLTDGASATLTSRVGSITVTVEVSDAMMPGVVSLPHGWGHDRSGIRLGIASAHAGVSINDVTDEMLIDPLSGNAAVSGVAVQLSAA